jgi:hypothetical protein
MYQYAYASCVRVRMWMIQIFIGDPQTAYQYIMQAGGLQTEKGNECYLPSLVNFANLQPIIIIIC